MAGREPYELGLYVRELRLSLRNNSGAYGYSVMITCVFAMLSAIIAPPGAGQIVVFFLGAIASFAVIETLATRGFTRGLDDREATKVIALGSSFNLASIASAVGLAAAVGHVVPTGAAWFLGPFLGSVTYLLVTAAEMSVARRVQEARHVQ